MNPKMLGDMLNKAKTVTYTLVAFGSALSFKATKDNQQVSHILIFVANKHKPF